VVRKECLYLKNNIIFSLQCSSYIPNCAEGIKPIVGMSFDTIKFAEEFYKSYAHKVGFQSILVIKLVIDEVVRKKFLRSR
jgi:hypothetical protein